MSKDIFTYITFLNMGYFSPLHNQTDFQKYKRNIQETWKPLTEPERLQLHGELIRIRNTFREDSYKHKIDKLILFIQNLEQGLKIPFL